MARQYKSPERPLSYPSSQNTVPSSSACSIPMIPLQDQDFTQGRYNLPDTSHASLSYDYRSSMTGFVQDQGRWIDGMDERFVVHTSEDRLPREYAVDGEGYAPDVREERLRGYIHRGSEKLSLGNRTAIEQSRVFTEGSRYALMSSPLSTGTTFDLATEISYNPLASCSSNVDGQDNTETIASGNESADGDGVPYNEEAEYRQSSFDSAQFEANWTEPSPCYLGGCRQGHLFPTSQSWHSHVKNVHKKALFCTVLDCSHTRPFANNTDLKRHNETIHDVKKSFKCERAICTRKVKAWSRKDKLKLHNGKYHSNYRCFYCSESPRHQRWFDTASELWTHTASFHPND